MGARAHGATTPHATSPTDDDIAYVALGSNQGDRARFLDAARERLAATAQVTVLRASPVEETAPIGPPGQGPYLNQMVALRTALPPRALLARLHEIEQALGRRRDVRWGARTIDLDIVAYEHARCDDPDLVVPHPELPRRSFWQRELAQLRE